jgi:hypothetical protein
MITNWRELALKVGSLNNDGSESGGESYGKAALEEILGEEWIQSTVDHIISFKRGSEVATDCLRLIHSPKAAFYAYTIYKLSDGEKADRAVWLIKQLAHPVSFSKSTVIAYKNGDFFSRLANCFIEYQYFNHNINKVFYKMGGSDTLFVDDYGRNPNRLDTIISITKYNNSDTILNKICNRIVIQRSKTKMSFIYSPELKLNADWYKNSRAEYYDVIYGQTKSVFLKYIIEGDGYISTAIATKINFKPVGTEVFPDVNKLPTKPL